MSNAFQHAKRRPRSARERAIIFAERGGRCAKCTRKCGVKGFDLDHIIPLSAGGSDDDDNLQILCDFCHDGKTIDDLGTAAKIKRQAIRHTVPAEHRRSRSWGRR